MFYQDIRESIIIKTMVTVLLSELRQCHHTGFNYEINLLREAIMFAFKYVSFTNVFSQMRHMFIQFYLPFQAFQSFQIILVSSYTVLISS